MATKPRPGKSATGWSASKTNDEEVAPGTQIGPYKIGEKLGKGAFAMVYKAFDTETGDFVAVKRISKQKVRGKTQQQRVLAEGQLMKRLDHPNITKFRDVIETVGHLHFILEYIDSGSLASLIQRYGSLSEKLCVVYIRQVLNGLCYLHEKGIVHRDIKSNNLLVTSGGVLKLSDFGIANLVDSHSDALKTLRANKSLQSSRDDTEIGSPYWMAPEIVALLEPTPASDIWSLGCTAIEFFTGKPPYFELSTAQACFRMAEDDHPPFPPKMSANMTEFMSKALVKDFKARATAVQLLELEWFKAGNPSSPVANAPPPVVAVVAEAVAPAEAVPAVVITPPPPAQPMAVTATAVASEPLPSAGDRRSSGSVLVNNSANNTNNKLGGSLRAMPSGGIPSEPVAFAPPPTAPPPPALQKSKASSGKRACYKCDGRLGAFSTKTCKGCKFTFCKKCCSPKDVCIDCQVLVRQHAGPV